MITIHTWRCGACGHVGRTRAFPVQWDEEQQRNYVSCPECGEDENIEGLMGGRGATASTIPADAMDQLMKQMPSGWFFPRKSNATR